MLMFGAKQKIFKLKKTMPLTKEELLTPRVMCTGTEGKLHYPGSPHKVGDIIELTGKSFEALTYAYRNEFGERQPLIENWDISQLDEMPHLYRTLAWHEHRKPEDLPQYVKLGNEVYKAVDHSDYLGGTFYVKSTNGFSNKSYPLKESLPATKEEYEQYINSKK